MKDYIYCSESALTKEEKESILKSVSHMRQIILNEYKFPNKEPFVLLRQKLINDGLAEDTMGHIADLLDAYLSIFAEQQNENK